MPIKITDETKCSGCTACASICPVNAISMIPDDLGFLYPIVDDDLCIDCNLCEKSCMYCNHTTLETDDTPLVVYAGRLSNEEELIKSQSGGAFWALAQSFINEDGVIYAAGYDNDFNVIHKRATTIEDAQGFRGSKYVQSNTVGIYRDIKKDLLNGVNVLFVGTGCQVDGLLNFLPNRLKEKLLCIDLICHASPSPAIWRSYLDYLNCRNKGKNLVTTNFRDKRAGWHSCIESFNFSGKWKYRKTFTILWNKHLTLRSSCSNCLFTKVSRKSDLTIGDFWGWEETHDEWCDNKGVSLIIVHTEKGKKILNKASVNLKLIDVTNDNYLQPQLQYPIEHSEERAQFINDYKTKGFYYIGCKYSNLGLINRLKEIKHKLFK